jgi:membrane protein
MNTGGVWDIIRNTAKEFVSDRTTTLGAALAYYAIFSIGPLLAIIVGLAGLLLSDAGVQQHVTQQFQGVVGPKSADVLKSMMASQHKGGSLLSLTLGIVLLLFAASGVFGQLKTSLNLIWQVKPKPGAGVAALVLSRVGAVIVILFIGALLLMSMLLTTFISAFYSLISRVIPLPHVVLQLLNIGITLLILTLLFTIVFKVLPDVKLRWADVWVGGFWTAILFLVGEFALSMYLSRKGTSSAYGAAGSVVLILMWIYYSTLILLTGAEFTRVYTTRAGARIEPRKNAIPMADPIPGQENRAWQT